MSKPIPKSVHKIVVFLNHGLGDVIMGTSFLKMLEEYYPQAVINIYVKSELEIEALKTYGFHKNFHYHSLRNYGIVKFFFKNFFSGNDLYFAPHAIDHIKYLLLSNAVNAKYSVGPDGRYGARAYDTRVKNEENLHKVKYTEKFLQVIHNEPLDFKGISFPENLNDVSFKKEFNLSDYHVISSGSGEVEKHKRWPIDKYIEFINKYLVNYQNNQIVLLGTEVELGMMNKIKSGVDDQDRCVIIIPKSIKESVLVMRGSKGLISGCNGSSHIGAACDIPVLGLYGPTNPGFTGVFSKKLVISRIGMSCSPCYKSSMIMGCGNAQCMIALSVDKVWSDFQRLLNQQYDDLIWCETKYIDSPVF